MPVAGLFSLTLTLVASTAILATLLGFLGRVWWHFELLGHFRPQLAGFLIICALFFVINAQVGWSIVAAGFALLNLTLILPLYRPRPVVNSSKPSRSILLSNVLGKNQQYEKLVSLIHTTDPDMIMLVEFRPALQQALDPELPDYTYNCLHPQDNNYGLALYSRLPVQSAEACYFTETELPVLITRLELDGHALTLILSHPFPPKRPDWTFKRDRQLVEIANFIAAQTGEVLLMGDLNITSWCRTFQDLRRLSGLRDSRQGFGIQPTWPALNPLLSIPIDHILHTPGISIHNRRTGAYIGSDHRPVILEFSMPDQT